MRIYTGLLLLYVASLPSVVAQVGIIRNVAGNGNSLFSGDGIPASTAAIGSPYQISQDANGNLFIADTGTSRIRRVDAATGLISTVAGGGVGNDGGLATQALLTSPCGVRVDASGNIYFSESCITSSGGAGPSFTTGNRVRRVDASTGIITTVVGNGLAGYNGDGILATSASLNLPAGIALDTQGNLYIADSQNHRIRRVNLATQSIATVAGNGVAGFSGDNNLAVLASLNNPVSVAVDAAGNLWIADLANQRIRKVDAASGIIRTVGGTGVAGFNGDGIPATAANLSFPLDLAADTSGNVYFSDGSNQRIRRIDGVTGVISTVVGGGIQPAADGLPATAVTLNQPSGLSLTSNGFLFFSERGANRVRVVQLGAASTTQVNLTISPNPATPFQPLTFTASVNPPTATGTVTFLASGNPVGSATLLNGVATVTVGGVPAGTYPIIASYTGGGGVPGASSAPVNLVVQTASSVTLSSSLNSVQPGQTFVLTAQVNPLTATGSVSFRTGVNLLGTAPVQGGVASLTTSLLFPGANQLTASYSGDSNLSGSTSAPISVQVKANATVQLTSTASTVLAGQQVTLTATVTPSNATGNVVFQDGGTTLGSVAIVNGVASLATAQLSPGTRTLIATYGGDQATANATSNTVTLVVQTASSLVLTSSANPVLVGQPVNLGANVTPLSATGTVTFLDGATILGSATITNGRAVLFGLQLPAGNRSLTATYSGDSLTASSSSSPLALVVKLASSLSLVTSASSLVEGQTVVLTANVTPASSTGSVVFRDGSKVLATLPVLNGVASLSTSKLGSGARSLSASYSGDSLTAGSESNFVTVAVQVRSNVSLSSSANPAFLGQSITFNASITPATATGTVIFRDRDVVLGSVPVANGVATLAVSQLALGDRIITATYSGNPLISASVSPALKQSVIPVPFSCRVFFEAGSDGPNRFGGQLSIINTGNTTISPWVLSWTWSGNQLLRSVENASFQQTGNAVQVTGKTSNLSIPPGGQVSDIKFLASFSGSNSLPSAFFVNGVRCH